MGDISIADTSAAESAEPRRLRVADEAGLRSHVLAGENGLALWALSSGFLYSIERGDILINQVLATPLAGGIHRIYLRILDQDVFRSRQITGPGSNSAFVALPDRFVWSGSGWGLNYCCYCWLPPGDDQWIFQLEIENTGKKPLICDAILVQDLGLATRGQVRTNERFTSQYLDHTVVPHARFGRLLMTRQNLPQTEGTHPWLLQGCFPRMAGFTTDGLDFFGVRFKDLGTPAALSQPIIGQRRRQYEAGYTAIQSDQIELPAGKSHFWAFFSQFSPDHPERSSSSNLNEEALLRLEGLCRTSAFAPPPAPGPTATNPPASLFETAPLFAANELVESEIHQHFCQPYRHEESAGVQRHSFFYGKESRHVVLKAKEISAHRSHGHILRSGEGLMPDAEVMSCSCYAAGVFASQMTLGNSVFAKFLTGVRDPFNIVRSSGLRIFIRQNPSEGWELLGVPSAFEMAPHFCRWYYKSEQGLVMVICQTSDEDAAFTYVVSSQNQPVELIFCGEVAAGPQEFESAPELLIDPKRARVTILPDRQSPLAQQQPQISFHAVSSTPNAIEAIGGAELIAQKVGSASAPYFAIRTYPVTRFSLSFVGTFEGAVRTEALCSKYEAAKINAVNDSVDRSAFWNDVNERLPVFHAISRASKPEALSEVQDALSWMAHNAIIHFSVPRGLEQANGGAWGVRDVCQGPLEFFLSQDRPEVVKAIVRKLFSQQFRQTGDWPQWFMFAPYQKVQARTSHGDILIWPLKALCDYLEQTNDGDLLHEELPYTDCETFESDSRVQSILKHVDALLAEVRRKCLPGLSLPTYGEGDWDDSLQPASETLAQRMVSSWTVALLYQTLRRYAVALGRFGEGCRAGEVSAFADQIQADYQRYLMPEGIVCGFAVFGSEPGEIEHYLLHPLDQRTGLRYRLISMTRGILSGIFSPEQAKEHLELIDKYLLYPDGARLIDRPTTYRGGVETLFRRSESAAFFGREIGLQYLHAHLRYAEVLAALGRADELFHALRVANPIAVTQVVTNATPRQRNAYFSSSDGAFRDRYEASLDYEKLRTGEIPVDGGWRIYSSGPGIFSNLVVRHLVGIRKYYDSVDFDPMFPTDLKRISCDLPYSGRKVRYEFKRGTGTESGSDGRVGQHEPAIRVTINGAELPAVSRTNGQYRRGGARLKKADIESHLTAGQNEIQIEL